MGVVYKAQDCGSAASSPLKVLPQATRGRRRSVERFRREARTASSLNHPNICTIYSFDEHDGQLYLAMELLEGEPLDRKLAGRPLDLRTILDLGTQIADALDAAHSEGILHRDIKPANIFLTRRGQVKVLDFGLAKLAPGFTRADEHDPAATEQFTSMAGTTVGTVAYMSPEQARGEDVDPRTDLFSFGVVLYEMATGRQSFAGATTAVVFDGILNRDPTPPSTLNARDPRRARSHHLQGARERSRAALSVAPPTCAPTCSDCGAIRDPGGWPSRRHCRSVRDDRGATTGTVAPDNHLSSAQTSSSRPAVHRGQASLVRAHRCRPHIDRQLPARKRPAGDGRRSSWDWAALAAALGSPS